jgi:hypothetical protein
MSISLKLELVKPIPISNLLSEIGEALRAILGLKFDPVITAEVVSTKETAALQSFQIEAGAEDVKIGIAGEPETVTVYPFTVPVSPYAAPPYTEPIPLESIKDKLLVGIYPETCGTPLELALAAAIAVSFSKHLESEIVDSIPFYTEGLYHTADNFLSHVKVDHQFDDYRVAAQRFYDRLPKALGQS